MLGAATVAFIMSLFPKGFWTAVFLGLVGFFVFFAILTPATKQARKLEVSSSEISYTVSQPDKDGYHAVSVTNRSDASLRELMASCTNLDGTKYNIGFQMDVAPHSSQTNEVQSVSAFAGATCKLVQWDGYKHQD